MGLTEAILAYLEKRLLSISLLIILIKCESIMCAESLIILGGILSGPVAICWFLSLLIYSFLPQLHVKINLLTGH